MHRFRVEFWWSRTRNCSWNLSLRDSRHTLRVLCAPTVADGVELLMAAAVDAVLLDCILPGETMWQIVLEADRQNVPVVLMTGNPAQMKDAALSDRPHIFKPFSLAALKRILEQTASLR